MDRIINELKLQKNKLVELKKLTQNNIKNEKFSERLRVSKSHGTFQYYVIDASTDRKGRYLRKEELKTAKRIAQRDYEKKVFNICQKNIEVIDEFINNYNATDISTVHLKNKGRAALITPYEKSIEEKKEEWLSESYKSKEFVEDSIQIYTNKGERVRSKSEKIIADMLYYMGIPYKYEKPLFLYGYGKVYPDFTIYDVKNDGEIILEHLGMMDNIEYVSKAIEKLLLYERNGYYIGEKLIVTFETGRNPLNSKMLEQRLWKYK